MSMMAFDAFKMVFGTPDKVPADVFDGSPRYISKNDLLALLILSARFRPRRFVEIGINEGKTAKMILEVSPWIEKYIGIDVLPGFSTPLAVQRREVPAKAGKFVAGEPRIELIVSAGGSADVTAEMIAGVEMAFIDGDHSFEGVERDTRLVDGAMTGGGIIVWHDYCSASCGVRKFIDERNGNRDRVCLLSHSNICFEVVPKVEDRPMV